MATTKATYNYCGICGHVPDSGPCDEPNWLRRWWDCDDGWKIGALCSPCWSDAKDDRPKPDDYAYESARHDICTDEPNTDEDPMIILDGLI